MEFLTTKEAQDMLGISESTLYKMLRDGRLKTYRVGRQYRISKSQIMELLTTQTQKEENIDERIISLFMSLSEDKKDIAMKYLEELIKE